MTTVPVPLNDESSVPSELYLAIAKSFVGVVPAPTIFPSAWIATPLAVRAKELVIVPVPLNDVSSDPSELYLAIENCCVHHRDQNLLRQ